MKKTILFPDIHGHRALFFCVHQFNLLPTRYIHASWLQGLIGSMQTDIRKIWKKNPRAEKHCAALIIKTFCHGFVYDFSDALRRVALMKGAGLARLMVYAGLAANTRSIMQTLSGRHIKALSSAFGPEAYEFAVTRAPLLAGPRRFDYLKPQRTDMDPQPGDILESGRQCLQICLEGSPVPLVQRLRLKFPRNMRWDFTVRSDDAIRIACRHLIQKIMKMEIRPKWNTALP
jgi:hypothetical protein